MKTSRVVFIGLVVAVAALPPARPSAQTAAPVPKWEVLVRVPLPADTEPVISVNGLTMPADPVGEHSHAGPTIGYIAAGEVENQVAPDPPAILKSGGYFYEAPRQLHKMMRNVSAAPAERRSQRRGR